MVNDRSSPVTSLKHRPRPNGRVGPHARQVEFGTQHGATLWFTGLPGAGKTTMAEAVRRELTRRGRPACILDGDALRAGLSSDLGLSRADRSEQARRAAHVAILLADCGVVALVALVSPYAADRHAARVLHRERDLQFCEIWVDTPVTICQQRDPKGLYARARSGALKGLTGVDGPYEPPARPDLRISESAGSPGLAAEWVVTRVLGEEWKP